MKKKLLLTVSLLALTSGSALAADLGRGGLKDGPAYDGGGHPAIWTGFTVGASAGWGNQNIDASRTIRGEGGLFRNDTKDEDGKTACEHTPQAENYGWCGTDFTADDTASPVRYEYPIISTLFNDDGDFDSSGLQGGLELGYRNQVNRWVFEGAVGGNLDAGDGKSRSYDTVHAVTIDPKGLFGGPYPVDPDDFALTGRGSLSIEKRGDIYGALRVSRLIDSEGRFAVGVGAGLTVGYFNIKGQHAFDGDDAGVLSTRYDESKASVGYMLEAFGRYKLTHNLDAGLIVTYKDWGSVQAGAATEISFNEDGSAGLYARVNDRAKADVTETAVKAALTYTFD
jgi:hypothetical protein